MRTGLAAVALCLCLGWAAPTWAQQQQASSFWTGVNPHNLTFTAIDTSKYLKNFNTAGAIRTPQQQKAFNLSNIFHGISLPSWPPKIGSSPQPPASANLFPFPRRVATGAPKK